MGCFEELRLPWDDGKDFEGPGAGAHVAENFRHIDRWANPLDISAECVSTAPCIILASGADGSTDGVFTLEVGPITIPVSGRVKVDAFMTIEGSAAGIEYDVTMTELVTFLGHISHADGTGDDICIPWTGVYDNLTAAEVTITLHLTVGSGDFSDFFVRGEATAIVGKQCGPYYNQPG